MQEPLTRPTEPDERELSLVSFVIATYNRKDDLAEAVQSVIDQSYQNTEVIVVSNATDGTADLFADGGRFDDPSVRFLDLDGRMGPPKARNIGYREADGDIVVTIDDDAVLTDRDATDRIVETFDVHPETGVLAFQSRDYYTGDVVRREIPDPPVGASVGVDDAYETTFFVGVGAAIRRSVLDEAGGFPERFVYGFEEMDLSLRVLDAGYGIRYEPSITVGHKKTAAGRTLDQASMANQLENRLRIMVRNLPWHHALVSAMGWAAYTALRGGPGAVSRAFREVFASRKEVLADRTVLEESTIERLRSMGGMFGWWYGPHPRRFLEDDVGLKRLWW